MTRFILSCPVGQLVRLERLSISGNLLAYLPETIGSLRNVSTVGFFYPRSVCLILLHNLKVTRERCYDIFSFLINTRGIYCLIMQLLILNVSNNKLKSLPESIGSCFSLEELQANGRFNLSFSLNYFSPD